MRDDSEVAASGKVTGALCMPRGHLEAKIDRASPGFVAGLDPEKDYPGLLSVWRPCDVRGQDVQGHGLPDVRNLGGFDDWVVAGGAVERMGWTGDA